MIARIWHGTTEAARADEYLDFLNRTWVLDYRAAEGNQGVSILRRNEGEKAHFLFISLWDSFESIRKGGGESVERARYYPEDEKFLLKLEPTVQHYEVLVKPERRKG